MILLQCKQCKLDPVTPQLKALQWLATSLKTKSKSLTLGNKASFTSLTSSSPLPFLPTHCAACRFLWFLRHCRAFAHTVASAQTGGSSPDLLTPGSFSWAPLRDLI